MENELKNVKIGDSLLIKGYNTKFIKNVLRITKAYIFCEGGYKIRKSDGKVIGEDKDASIPTPDVIKKIENEKKRFSLSIICAHTNFRSLSLEKLEKIYAIIKGK